MIVVRCDFCDAVEQMDFMTMRPPPCRAIVTWIPEDWIVEGDDSSGKPRLRCTDHEPGVADVR